MLKDPSLSWHSRRILRAEAVLPDSGTVPDGFPYAYGDPVEFLLTDFQRAKEGFEHFHLAGRVVGGFVADDGNVFVDVAVGIPQSIEQNSDGPLFVVIPRRHESTLRVYHGTDADNPPEWVVMDDASGEPAWWDCIIDSTQQAIESAALQSATNTANSLPVPTDAQQRAGNYKKGTVWLGGLLCAIESPKGAFRTGIDPNGKPWRSQLMAHYGYIKNTLGNDGDPVDCFIGPNADQAAIAYVINQRVGGAFDEHKVMLAFASEDAARRAYLGSYQQGWAGLQSIVPVTLPQLQWWLRHGDMRRPIQSALLPYLGIAMDNTAFWDSANPAADHEAIAARIHYQLALEDADDGLLLEPMTPDDLATCFGGECLPDAAVVLDGISVPFRRLQARMQKLARAINTASNDKTVIVPNEEGDFARLGKPTMRKVLGQATVNQDVTFPLADGQTLTVLFHNPDTTPTKLVGTDELISWKWLLNKRDVTIAVAPEQGRELTDVEIAARIARLAAKNMRTFESAQQRKGAQAQELAMLTAEEEIIDQQLEELAVKIEAAKIEAAKVVAEPAEGSGAIIEAETVYGEKVQVRSGSIEGDPNGKIRTFTKDGKPKGWIARGNLLVSGAAKADGAALEDEMRAAGWDVKKSPKTQQQESKLFSEGFRPYIKNDAGEYEVSSLGLAWAKPPRDETQAKAAETSPSRANGQEPVDPQREAEQRPAESRDRLQGLYERTHKAVIADIASGATAHNRETIEQLKAIATDYAGKDYAKADIEAAVNAIKTSLVAQAQKVMGM